MADLPERMVSGHLRMEQRSGLIGIDEKAGATTVWDDGTPWESENELFEPDLDRILPWLQNAMVRMPVLAERGLRRPARVVEGALFDPANERPRQDVTVAAA